MSDWIITYAAGVITGVTIESIGWPWYWTALVLVLISVRVIFVAVKEIWEDRASSR